VIEWSIEELSNKDTIRSLLADFYTDLSQTLLSTGNNNLTALDDLLSFLSHVHVDFVDMEFLRECVCYHQCAADEEAVKRMLRHLTKHGLVRMASISNQNQCYLKLNRAFQSELTSFLNNGGKDRKSQDMMRASLVYAINKSFPRLRSNTKWPDWRRIVSHAGKLAGVSGCTAAAAADVEVEVTGAAGMGELLENLGDYNSRVLVTLRRALDLYLRALDNYKLVESAVDKARLVSRAMCKIGTVYHTLGNLNALF
jgi:hypothetical protein